MEEESRESIKVAHFLNVALRDDPIFADVLHDFPVQHANEPTHARDSHQRRAHTRSHGPERPGIREPARGLPDPAPV
jgi:hypothetical protein